MPDDKGVENGVRAPESSEKKSGEDTKATNQAQSSASDPQQEQNGSKGKKASRRVSPWLILSGTIVAAFLLLVFAAWAGEHLGYAVTHQATDDARVDADSLIITSKISERVDRVFTDTNRFVRRGQLLVQLDDRDERARLASAIASRNGAAAQVWQAQQNVLLTRAQVATESTQSRGNVVTASSSVVNASDSFAASARQAAALRAAAAQARAEYRAALAALPGARETVTRDALDLERDSALVRTGDVDQSDVDSDRAAYETALSQYREDEDNVVSQRANSASAVEKLRSQQAETAATAATIGEQQGSELTAQGKLNEAQIPYRITTQEAALAAARKTLDSQQAQVRQAEDQLSYTRIVSPSDGTVAEKSLATGQMIGAGQTLFTIVPAYSLYVTANFKETQLNLMRVGQPVDIHVDGYPEFTFVGHVFDFNPAAQNEFALLPAQNSSGNFVKVTQRVPVRIAVDRGGDRLHPLRPGMSVEAYVRVR